MDDLGTAPASLRFAHHALDTRTEDVPASAVHAAKIFILDTIGVGVAGASAQGAREVLGRASAWGVGAEARVWGTEARLPAPGAALANGFQVHCQEYDCLHEGAVLHAMATLLPAALAWAEREGGVSGRALIAAVALGVDVAVGLGLAAKSGLRFFRPATAGGFGAVAAVGRLAGFDADRLADAFGLQYAQTSGTMQPHVEACVVLPFQVAVNARAAVESCDLAAAGMHGPREVFEGRFGYLPLFEGEWDLAPIWPTLGRDWRIVELSHKPFPAGRATHGGIEGVMALRAAHGFAADDVVAVTVVGPPLIARLCGRPAIPAPNAAYARLCMGYVIAKLLLHGRLDPTHFRDEALADPATFALAQRVRTEDDGTSDPNALAPQRVVVELTDGRRLRWEGTTILAHPLRPLSREQHLAKFRRCWQLAATPLPAPQGEHVIALVDELEGVADVRTLAAALGPA
jgi:aconitate decarboxylase